MKQTAKNNTQLKDAKLPFLDSGHISNSNLNEQQEIEKYLRNRLGIEDDLVNKKNISIINSIYTNTNQKKINKN